MTEARRGVPFDGSLKTNLDGGVLGWSDCYFEVEGLPARGRGDWEVWTRMELSWDGMWS